MKSVHLKTKYLDDDVYIEIARYHDNSRAVLFRTELGEPAGVATVCLSDFGEKPADGNIFIKDWSENEGMLKGMQALGIIGEPIREINVGFVTAYECKFLLDDNDERVSLRR